MQVNKSKTKYGLLPGCQAKAPDSKQEHPPVGPVVRRRLKAKWSDGTKRESRVPRSKLELPGGPRNKRGWSSVLPDTCPYKTCFIMFRTHWIVSCVLCFLTLDPDHRPGHSVQIYHSLHHRHTYLMTNHGVSTCLPRTSCNPPLFDLVNTSLRSRPRQCLQRLN